MFDCKDIGIRKSEFVTKNQFLCNKYKNKKYPICKKKSEIKDKHWPNFTIFVEYKRFSDKGYNRLLLSRYGNFVSVN